MKTKKFFTYILAALIMFGTLSLQGISSVISSAENVDNGVMRDNMTAQQYADDMGLGINLGNTMEAYWLDRNRETSGSSTGPGKTPHDFEKCWGAVVTTQEIIDGMKNAGFNTVRIPVYWGNMMEEDGTYTINPQYIGRVKEIVDYCRKAGLYAVINMHHYDEFVIRHYTTFGTLDECAETIKHLWTQIAEYFEGYSDYLIFEGFNEYLGGGPYKLDENGKILTDSKSNPTILDLPKDEAYKWTNTLNQAFVDAVRATGGNNTKRMLIASGYFTNIDNTTNPAFKMPTDTAKDRLMVSVHYVDSNAYWSQQIGSKFWELFSISQLNLLKKSFTERGIPVFIGETTSIYNDDLFSENAKVKSTSVALDYIMRLIKSYGFIPVLWDVHNIEEGTNKNISFYSRETCKIQSEENEKVIKTLSKEITDGTFVPIDTSYLQPIEKEDALGVINFGDLPINLASGTADSSMAGAKKIRYIFDCASDVSFNPWAGINLSAMIAGKESKTTVMGENDIKGEPAVEVILDLSNQINSGDSYTVFASTYSWEDARDYVYLIRCIEFLDASGNVIKTIGNSKRPLAQTTDPTTTKKQQPAASITTTRKPVNTTINLEKVKKDKTAAKKLMKKAKIKKLTLKSKLKKKVTVSWKKVKKVKGYQVQVSAKKNFKKIIYKKFAKKNKLTVKSSKIKSKKTYYIRVRAYTTYKDKNGKAKKVYSKWAKAKKVKVK